MTTPVDAIEHAMKMLNEALQSDNLTDFARSRIVVAYSSLELARNLSRLPRTVRS